MTRTIPRHRSMAYVKPISERGRNSKPNSITNQFRFIVRMAYACHEQNVPYDLIWNRQDSQMAATITATGNIPMPKPLPKPPKARLSRIGNPPSGTPCIVSTLTRT
jgi:hypothetical protein